jgi:hypothetical protein
VQRGAQYPQEKKRGRMSARGVLTASMAATGLWVGVALVADGLHTPKPPPQPSASEALPNGSDAAAAPPSDSDLLTLTLPPILRAATPTRIRIPGIRVNAPLTALGLDPTGRLAAPPERSRNLAGWYRGGAAPGEFGTAVIAGHVDNRQGPAVFYNLGALKRNEEVDVDRSDGMTAVFTIDAVEAFEARSFPNAKVYADTNRAELRIITCGGGFDKRHGHYQGNVVVFAHLTAARARGGKR